MKKNKWFLLLILVVLVTACTSTKKSSSSADQGNNRQMAMPKSTDDGLSYATAIVMTEKSDLQATDAEYEWIKNHYNNYKIKGQALAMHNKKPYDIITIELSDNKELPLYFDISNTYGKL